MDCRVPMDEEHEFGLAGTRAKQGCEVPHCVLSSEVEHS